MLGLLRIMGKGVAATAVHIAPIGAAKDRTGKTIYT